MRTSVATASQKIPVLNEYCQLKACPNTKEAHPNPTPAKGI